MRLSPRGHTDPPWERYEGVGFICSPICKVNGKGLIDLEQESVDLCKEKMFRFYLYSFEAHSLITWETLDNI